jgi:hypothetical protein
VFESELYVRGEGTFSNGSRHLRELINMPFLPVKLVIILSLAGWEARCVGSWLILAYHITP